MTTLETLQKAKSLIEDPKHWTTRALARDSGNEPVTATSFAACRWCAIGALEKVSQGAKAHFRTAEYFEALNSLRKSLQPYESVSQVNDSDGHKAVLSLFDKAIEMEKSNDCA